MEVDEPQNKVDEPAEKVRKLDFSKFSTWIQNFTFFLPVIQKIRIEFLPSAAVELPFVFSWKQKTWSKTTIYAIEFVDQTTFAIATNKYVEVCQIQDNGFNLLKSYEDCNETFYCLKVISNTENLVAGGAKGVLRVINIETDEQHVFEGKHCKYFLKIFNSFKINWSLLFYTAGGVNDLKLIESRKQIVTCSDDLTVRLWCMLEKKCVAVFSTMDIREDLTCLSISPDSSSFACASLAKIAIWKLQSPETAKAEQNSMGPNYRPLLDTKPLFITEKIHKGEIDMVKFLTNTILVSKSLADDVKLWKIIETPSGRIIHHVIYTWEVHLGGEWYCKAEIDPTNQFLTFGGFPGAVCMIDLKSKLNYKVEKFHKSQVLEQIEHRGKANLTIHDLSFASEKLLITVNHQGEVAAYLKNEKFIND